MHDLVLHFSETVLVRIMIMAVLEDKLSIWDVKIYGVDSWGHRMS